jgi:hypothetical protein
MASIRWLCLLGALSFAVGCPPLKIDPDPRGADAGSNGTMTVPGQVCTPATGASPYPVKILFLVDGSGSMCVSDGPGSQASSGFCETFGAQLRAQGITTPGRVRSLRSLIDQLKSRPEVSVALVPFDLTVVNAHPAIGFVPASDADLPSRIDALQNQLGAGTDYQGALREAYARIAGDIQEATVSGGQATLQHTKYVVVFLTDGTPYPRCATDDSNSDPSYYATVANPAGIWRDNPASFCANPAQSGDGGTDNPECLGTNCPGDAGVPLLPGFTGGDRNQNYQLFGAADALLGLASGVGEIRFHAVLLFNKGAINLCGQICVDDMFDGDADGAESVAKWTLTEMATKHGGGSFTEFQNGQAIDLSAINFASLACP